jgi:predicted anti-sigma-YlaC factor YlaD
MDCKRIQELLITDYMDGEASAEIRQQVKAHLAVCAQCREFEQVLRQKVVAPFENLEAVKPPETVWQGIKETITEESEAQESVPQQVPETIRRMFDFLRQSFAVRRPAFALSTAFSILLVVFLFAQGPIRRQIAVNDYIQEQSTIMLSLNTPVNGDMDQEINFGTSIERYLF